MNLEPAAVHLWAKTFDGAGELDSAKMRILTASERQRAERIRPVKIRAIWASARVFLKSVLAKYLEIEPYDVSFRYNDFGKPYVDTIGSTLSFNFTHANHAAVVAVSTARQLGVDIEYLDRDIDFDEMASLVLSEDESAYLGSLPCEQSAASFLRLWTAKEAFSKAIGLGLSVPLTRISIDLTALPSPQLSVPSEYSATGNWSLVQWSPFPSYVASVVADGEPWIARFFQL